MQSGFLWLNEVWRTHVSVFLLLLSRKCATGRLLHFLLNKSYFSNFDFRIVYNKKDFCRCWKCIDLAELLKESLALYYQHAGATEKWSKTPFLRSVKIYFRYFRTIHHRYNFYASLYHHHKVLIFYSLNRVT
jgi:hypothetical protein